MALVFGNTAKALDQRRHAWMFYVRGDTEHIAEVTIKLHPTFKEPVRTLREPPFEFKSRGWGTFDIDVIIKWKGEKSGLTRATWALQFDEADRHKEMVAVPPAVLQAAAVASQSTPATPSAVAGQGQFEDHGDVAAVIDEMVGRCSIADSGDDDPMELDNSTAVALTVTTATGTTPGTAGAAAAAALPPKPAATPAGGDRVSEEATGATSAAAAPEVPEVPKPLRAQSAGSDNADPGRASICSQLRQTPFQAHGSPLFMYGRAYDGPQLAPKVLWRSDKPPRKDHSAPKWLTATEYEDVSEVMASKVKRLAALMRHSRKTVAYTGAGISAAVIGQAALSGQNTVGWKNDTRAAPPTFTHHALGFLGREGLLHGWVQQNHDGLPQKAGFPQERINEIHGSWYDPGNPVVKYSGTLHERSYPWMRHDAETADLVLVLGTSLGGLNADQVAVKTAERTLLPPGPSGEGSLEVGAWVRAVPPGKGQVHEGLITSVQGDGGFSVRFRAMPASADSDDEQESDEEWMDKPVQIPKGQRLVPLKRASGGLGSVCINLQQTAQDGKMSLRIFGKSDDVLRLLLQELGYTTTAAIKPPAWPKVSRARVPYGENGKRLKDGAGKRMWLDLRPGQQVKITPGHNIQGAKQPMYMHIGAKKAITTKSGETRAAAPGNGVVVSRDDVTCSFVLRIEGVQMRLGIWWLVSAMHGGVEVLPIVNRSPEFE